MNKGEAAHWSVLAGLVVLIWGLAGITVLIWGLAGITVLIWGLWRL